jgi:hypothetical protein
VTNQEGKTAEFKFLPRAAQAGFLLNPIITDLIDFMDVLGGNSPNRVTRIRIGSNTEYRRYFAPKATLRVYSLPALKARPAASEFWARREYPMFMSRPSSVRSTYRGPRIVDGRGVLMVHAPGTMEFHLDPGVTRISGTYGFLPEAYLEGKTDGVVFRVVVTRSGQTHLVIWEHYLQPSTNSLDRGLHTFRATIPPGAGGELFLETAPGPRNDSWRDWSVWSDVEIR